ncbi:MAG TPA: hypothetical protein DCE41_22415, partial [Cytophagales bacterium]|nr:hypothetical protein [Cytophagales bacterium]
KARMEGAFGVNLDHLRVNKNSGFPAKVGAIATTRGNQIDVAPGHYNPTSSRGQQLLGHEAWHTVQQASGRVKPTLQMKTGHLINDSSALEQDADRAGEAVAAGRSYSVRGQMAYSGERRSIVQRQVSFKTKTAPKKDSPLKALADALPKIDNFYLYPANEWNNPNLQRDSNDFNLYAQEVGVPQKVVAVISGKRRDPGARKGTSLQSMVGNMGDQEVALQSGKKTPVYAGGHLVGDQMFDDVNASYKDYNLAPQHEKFNAPVYSGLIEQLVAQGAVNKNTNSTNKEVPIKLTIELSYAAEQYSVTVKDLIAKNLLSSDEVSKNGYVGSKTINIATRIPKEWKTQAEIDTSEMELKENPYRFGMANFTDKQEHFYSKNSKSEQVPTNDFTFKLNNPIVEKGFGGKETGGGTTIGITALHGLPNSKAKPRKPEKVIAEAPMVPQIYSTPLMFNHLTQKQLKKVLLDANGVNILPNNGAGKLAEKIVDYRIQNGFIQDQVTLFKAINRSKGYKLTKKAFPYVNDLFNPINMDYSEPSKKTGYGPVKGGIPKPFKRWAPY